MPRFKSADYGHLLETRHHTGRSDLTTGRDQRDLVARVHAHIARQFPTQHNAKSTRHQPRQHRLLRATGHVGDLRLQRRSDAAHQRAFHVLAPRQQRLHADEGRSAYDLGVGAGLADGLRGIGQCAFGAVNLNVRDHAEHAVAHFFLEAVHHAEHNDQRGHPQRDAQHGHTGDERDEPVAPGGPACPRVAPAYAQLKGKLGGKD